MPGFLEDLDGRLARMESVLASLAAFAKQPAPSPHPLSGDEEVWADGALSVVEAADFLRVSRARVFQLIESGELVSAKDGRRLVAKRGCVRYLLAHQDHVGATA